MRKQNRALAVLLSGCAMIILILDSKTAINSAIEGIDICLRTIIPSLLPFFFLSIILTNAAADANIPFLQPLGKLCGMPLGSEHILLIGLLGGYPVGAQTVTEAYSEGYLSKKDAHRILGFCNNAGPAFIFGIVGSLFSSKIVVVLLWLIHIASALIVGIILPGKSNNRCTVRQKNMITLTDALTKAIRITATVCGWVVVFRILIAFLCRWVLWIFPDIIELLLIGFLELANGCYNLNEITSDAVRFILCSVILAFGGTCVYMQTISATGILGTGWYLVGKIMQAVLSGVLSAITVLFLYHDRKISIPLLCVIPVILVILFMIFKKTVAFLDKQIYNNKKSKEPVLCCSEKRLSNRVPIVLMAHKLTKNRSCVSRKV